MLAEAALLQACVEAGGYFARRVNVYSYRIASRHCRRGVFEPYIDGFQERQADIRGLCEQHPNDCLLYLDLKKFYPSIKAPVARSAWTEAAGQAGLPRSWIDVGHKLLDGQFADSDHLLTGPLFSHLIGNLVLAPFDAAMCGNFGMRYLRYVDDIALVLPAGDGKRAEDIVVRELNRLGLALNQNKRVQSTCKDWLRGVEDAPADDIAEQWKVFAGGLRRRLVTKPDSQPALDRKLQAGGFRIPLTSYERAATDAGWWLRLHELVGFRRFWSGVRHLSEEAILTNAFALRETAQRAFFGLAQSGQTTTGIQRKRMVQHLRFLSSKLMLLAAPDVLPALVQSLQSWSELLPQQAIFNALHIRDVAELVSFGAKPCASVGRLLALGDRPVRCQVQDRTDKAVEIEGVAVLLASGARFEEEWPDALRHEQAIMFAAQQSGAYLAGHAKGDYWRELFALAGPERGWNHAGMLESAFDIDEELVFDPDQLLNYCS
ncbi:MAG: RNA-directed DNA polymerase [Chloroflexi bacterium]|nr:RNA-directed DNA polymerase [Chloroflexota bacterium]